MPKYNADHLFVMVDPKDRKAESAFQTLQQSADWQSLHAVKQRHVYVLPYDRWWMYTPLAVDGQLDYLAQHLAN